MYINYSIFGTLPLTTLRVRGPDSPVVGVGLFLFWPKNSSVICDPTSQDLTEKDRKIEIMRE
jgi:hypothetical protein